VALNYVALTCDLYDGTGAQISQGTASFAPSAVLTDTTDHEYIPQAPVVVSFRAAGLPVVSLLATDNGPPAPSGWAWTVTFAGVPGSPASFSFFLPYASGASQYLSGQAPVSSVTTMTAYMPLSGGQFTGHVEPAIAVLTDGTTIALDASKGNLFRITLAGNHTLASPTNGIDGQMIRVEVTPAGHTLSYGAAYNFGDAGIPALNSAKRNTLGFTYNATALTWDFLGAGTGF
jgi:hypothetical protein